MGAKNQTLLFMLTRRCIEHPVLKKFPITADSNAFLWTQNSIPKVFVNLGMWYGGLQMLETVLWNQPCISSSTTPIFCPFFAVLPFSFQLFLFLGQITSSIITNNSDLLTPGLCPSLGSAYSNFSQTNSTTNTTATIFCLCLSEKGWEGGGGRKHTVVRPASRQLDSPSIRRALS